MSLYFSPVPKSPMRRESFDAGSSRSTPISAAAPLTPRSDSRGIEELTQKTVVFFYRHVREELLSNKKLMKKDPDSARFFLLNANEATCIVQQVEETPKDSLPFLHRSVAGFYPTKSLYVAQRIVQIFIERENGDNSFLSSLCRSTFPTARVEERAPPQNLDRREIIQATCWGSTVTFVGSFVSSSNRSEWYSENHNPNFGYDD